MFNFLPYEYREYAVPVIVLILIIMFVLKKLNKHLHSHWNQMIDGLKFSTNEFYDLVDQELQEQGISDVKYSIVKHPEGSILSSSRRYFRIRWKGFTYDICFAPFAQGSFVSWWLFHTPGGIMLLLLRIPIIGWILGKLFYRETYYSIDTASMFMTAVQQAILRVLDNLTTEQGLKSLTEDQRKPIMRDVFAR